MDAVDESGLDGHETEEIDGLRAPFPWFGGKSRVAHLVWERFGDVPNYVEPFCGSMAVLLCRPHRPRIETVNDKDCYIANFWRAVEFDAEAVAYWADWPVNEADLHARHLWLVGREEFRERMKQDPEYFDAKIAGWWVWGISCWIGGGWCSRPDWDGRISGVSANRGLHHSAAWQKRQAMDRGGRGVHGQGGRGGRKQPMDRQHQRGEVQRSDGTQWQSRPAMNGMGIHSVHQKMPKLNRGNNGLVNSVKQQIPDLGGANGCAGRGVVASGKRDPEAILNWLLALQARIRNVRVCCGDWKRLTGRSPTECIGTTAVFLDPPYSDCGRDARLYSEDDMEVAHEAREWAIKNGGNKLLRIALCGYEGEHQMPWNWTCMAWKANGGHGNSGNGHGRDNAKRERIWFSPHCLAPKEPELFERLKTEV